MKVIASRFECCGRAERHRSRHVHRDHHVHLALGVRVAHERRAHPRRHVPVDAPDVVARPVGLVLVEVEAGAAQRALVGADALVADLPAGRDLDVAQLPHHVLGDHGIGTAVSSSCEDGVGVHVLRLRAHRPRDAVARRVAEDLLHVFRQHPGPAVQERGDPAQRQQVLVGARRDAELQHLAQIGAADAARIARRAAEPDDVLEDLGVDVDRRVDELAQHA